MIKYISYRNNFESESIMFYIVRHGEPDYSEANSKIYNGFGSNMCTLTPKGCDQIKNTAKDSRLKNADIIITSPYGRALHTAAILSKELNVDIIVETDLHEWLANKYYIHESDDVADSNYNEFHLNNGCYPPEGKKDWETAEMMKKRAVAVLKKYKDYNNVIVTCHGMLIEAITGRHHPKHGEIIEFEL